MTRDIGRYVGVPYVDKGRDPKEGVDCWGLLCWFYAAECGVVLPSYTDQASGLDPAVGAVVLGEIARSWIKVKSPEFGDAVVVTVSNRPFHVGIYVGSGRMLHAMSVGQGSVIEALSGPKWANRIEGYYRYV